MRLTPTTSDIEVSRLEEQKLGRITQVIGPILDAVFSPGKMPYIYNALIVQGRDIVGQKINVTCEVQQLLGNNRVRVVAMSATDGLKRGMSVIDTGAPICVPVGGATLGRIFNMLGEPIDNLGLEVSSKFYLDSVVNSSNFSIFFQLYTSNSLLMSFIF